MAAESDTTFVHLQQRLGESNRLIDCLFANILAVPYMDPTLDRCAAVHEWLSSCDLSPQFGDLNVSATVGVTHLLCRVENKQELTFSTVRPEPDEVVMNKFCHGLRLSRSLAVLETIPYALWMLSSGGALHRAATSIELLTPPEKEVFDEHVDTLVSLGLTYQHGELEPPIHNLVPVVADNERPEVSPAVSLAVMLRGWFYFSFAHDSVSVS